MTYTVSKGTAVTLAVALALSSLLVFASTASAYDRDRGGDDGTSVSNSNEATVTNTQYVKANTGGNDANGGDGDDGGDGGRAKGDEATGGNGGAGGAGGAGGTITTGAAAAFGTIYNNVNYNYTEADPCGCEDNNDFFSMFFNPRGGDDDGVSVRNRNSASVVNDQTVKAYTGWNDANGGDGDDGGDGGSAYAGHDRNRDMHFMSFFWWGDDDEGPTGGNGGRGGAGAAGGTIRTGEAYAEGYIDNIVNSSINKLGGANEEVVD